MFDMARRRIDNNIKKVVRNFLVLLKEDNVNIEQAFIFGSYAKGCARKDSDIDVAIVSSDIRNSLASTKYLLHKAHQLDTKRYIIEPHGFHPREFVDNNPIVREIKTTGATIK